MIALLLATLFTFVELNCENLFDYTHDTGKNDHEYLPTATRKWDNNKYWSKLNNIARTIVACGGEADQWSLPDMVALTEVENDSVLHHLTTRSLLRNAGYQYVMTQSDDERGIDVALLYSPFSFRILSHYSLRIPPPAGHHSTRDILYVKGIIVTGDTLHVMVVHAPSRVGGRTAREYRLRLAERLTATVDSLRHLGEGSHLLIAGDFNDLSTDSTLTMLCHHGLTNLTSAASGRNGARGTYKHQGRWGSLDHILSSDAMANLHNGSQVIDLPFLTEEDEKYGGIKPRRTYIGMRYNGGTSDHLPLTATFKIGE